MFCTIFEAIKNTMENVKKIGEGLLMLRTQAKLTQYDVMVSSGLTPKQIVALEKGRTDYRINTLLSYLKAVNADVSIKPNKN